MDKCSNCAVSRSCRHCYTGLATDKEFLFTSNVCKNVESDKKFSWANSLEIAEAYTEFVESGFYRYKLIKKYCGD